MAMTDVSAGFATGKGVTYYEYMTDKEAIDAVEKCNEAFLDWCLKSLEDTTGIRKHKKRQPAYDDELFGPVASLIKVKDAEDAMRIANDSRLGLGGGIFSKDENKVIDLAQKYFDTGMVFINFFGLAQPNIPFGGVKNSGYGNEDGGFGIKEFIRFQV